jgi:hypothetical protein
MPAIRTINPTACLTVVGPLPYRYHYELCHITLQAQWCKDEADAPGGSGGARLAKLEAARDGGFADVSIFPICGVWLKEHMRCYHQYECALATSVQLPNVTGGYQHRLLTSATSFSCDSTIELSDRPEQLADC